MIYYLAKIFTAFLLPPGIFILFFIFAAKYKKFFLIPALLLYLLSTTFFSNLLLANLENFKNSPLKPKAVVVLGGGANYEGLILSYSDAFKREVYGLILAKKYNLPLIFTGICANRVKKDFNLLIKNFNLKTKIIYENRSKNTFENAKYCAKLFEKLNLKKEIFLVTNSYHIKRASLFFEKFGFKVVKIGVDKLQQPIKNFLDFLPSMGALKNSYKAIHEYIGIAASFLY
jgi:uncharacterized SAM-binding protein YcdF (DUF218 family)